MTHPVSACPNNVARTIAPRSALSCSGPVTQVGEIQYILVDEVVHMVAPPLSLHRPDAFQHPYLLRHCPLGHAQKVCKSIDAEGVLVTLAPEEPHRLEAGRVSQRRLLTIRLPNVLS